MVPIGIGDRESRHEPGGFPLRDNNRCLTRLVCCLHSLTVERRPQRLQKTDSPWGSGDPHDGQFVFRKTGFCSNVVPQRVQKRDWLSMAGVPQLLQRTGSLGILAPHRLQNCASSSDTTVPHPGRPGIRVFFLQARQSRTGCRTAPGHRALRGRIYHRFCHVLHQGIIHIIADFFRKSLKNSALCIL